MRIVMVGASGNVGTAVLTSALAAGHVVDGVSRRAPAAGGIYDKATWHSIDLTDTGALPLLTEAMRGADAVVHAAWAIQPSHDREYLRQVNVEGSRIVAQALAGAGVPRLVYLSSVGAYAERQSLNPVDETWPTTGIPSSSYSEDKAAVETLLDEFELVHPDVSVTRLRPALILQRDAASEIQRYFTGPLVPGPLWKLASDGRLPVLPIPSGLALQFVHATDVADAVLAAAERGYRGAVNLAAEPIMDGRDLSAVLGGRVIPMPRAAVRTAASVAWQAHVLPASPGWIDLAMAVPLLRADRAREDLDWHPRWNAQDTLRDLVGGLADGAGVSASPALRPRA
ncbi:NAD-dependent epimerase/dehydratase family protein [Actinokineospora iranica]|uniref:Nucleoside-diphosphate-sugar epimerase n=1 Tax=Actinokineospora iranica TaxID=1271860 RepID=A0A1G6RZ52_9PSEU|nr:NAD-dependent epimerase/dehydratase family protein [Actinokineospora iranica]SDD09703.1 Nucleoside-diphosphate-sugar epimerase [Actinokineospora iranica]